MVYAFEPLPPVREALLSTVRVNRCAPRVKVEPFALGRALGEATLYVPVQDHGLIETSATLNPHFKQGFGETLQVQVLTLDFYDLERHPGRSTVIKIDVESMEADVLRGAMRILKTHRPVVFCEVLPNGDTSGIEFIRRQIRYTDIRLRPDALAIGSDVEFDPAAWNHLLVPNEKVDRVLEVIERCGLEVRWPVTD